MQGLVEFSWTLFFQLANTIGIYLLLKHFLFKPVTQFMENRSRGIENAIQDAQEKNKEAEALKTDYQIKLNNIKDERNQIIKEASKKAEKRSEEIIKGAQGEAQKILEKADADLKREKQKTINELKNQVSILSIMAASKVIEKELNQNEHNKFIKQFIEEVGETQWHN